jgi:hypothetical protein
MRNDIVLMWCGPEGLTKSHFKMSEFESAAGYCMVDSDLLDVLERTRADLCETYGVDVQIVIKSGLRTEADNGRLAEKLGWVDDGGLVARDSRHLPKYGGIAVDIRARYRKADEWVYVPQATLGSACRAHCTFVKDDYPDGHVHADCRKTD